MEREFIVGFIRGAFGVSGDCKIQSASGEYAHIMELKSVTLVKGDFCKNYDVERAEMKGSFLCLKFRGVDSPEAVRALTGASVVVQQGYAKPLGKDEWYIDDLIGCSLVYHSAVNSADALDLRDSPSSSSEEDAVLMNHVGRVTGVVEGGGCYLLEVVLAGECSILERSVKYTEAGKLRTVYVPLKNEHIGEVDIEKKQIELLDLWILE